MIARENVELTSMSQQEGSSGSASRSSKDGNWKSNGNFKSNHKGKSGYKKEKAIGHALVADSRSPTCNFCQGEHYADKCLKVKGLKQRKEYCSENKLCFSCLRPGHYSSSCKSEKPCYYCQKTGHHQALCNENDKKSSNGKRDTPGITR